MIAELTVGLAMSVALTSTSENGGNAYPPCSSSESQRWFEGFSERKSPSDGIVTRGLTRRDALRNVAEMIRTDIRSEVRDVQEFKDGVDHSIVRIVSVLESEVVDLRVEHIETFRCKGKDGTLQEHVGVRVTPEQVARIEERLGWLDAMEAAMTRLKEAGLVDPNSADVRLPAFVITASAATVVHQYAELLRAALAGSVSVQLEPANELALEGDTYAYFVYPASAINNVESVSHALSELGQGGPLAIVRKSTLEFASFEVEIPKVQPAEDRIRSLYAIVDSVIANRICDALDELRRVRTEATSTQGRRIIEQMLERVQRRVRVVQTNLRGAMEETGSNPLGAFERFASLAVQARDWRSCAVRDGGRRAGRALRRLIQRLDREPPILDVTMRGTRIDVQLMRGGKRVPGDMYVALEATVKVVPIRESGTYAAKPEACGEQRRCQVFRGKSGALALHYFGGDPRELEHELRLRLSRRYSVALTAICSDLEIATPFVLGEALAAETVRPVSTQPMRDLDVRVNEPGKMLVIRGQFDNVSQVLASLGFLDFDVQWHQVLSDLEFLSKYDYLFINCGLGSPSPETKQVVAAWVRAGGTLYASDWAFEYVTQVYRRGGEPVRFPRKPRVGLAQTMYVGSEQPSVLRGHGVVPIDFDLSQWVMVSGIDPTRTLVLLHEACDDAGRCVPRPIAMRFPHGRGHVVYTSFHLHQQTSDIEWGILDQVMMFTLNNDLHRDNRRILTGGRG